MGQASQERQGGQVTPLVLVLAWLLCGLLIVWLWPKVQEEDGLPENDAAIRGRVGRRTGNDGENDERCNC